MAASRYSGSTSSFSSSALGVPPPFGNSATSPPDQTFTPTSAVSALTSESSAPFGPLDLGPPGYNATIKLYNQGPNETTVFLGPWEVVNTEPRRVVWQCSYAGEVLEHFLSSDHPAEVYPFTLHAQHRRFGDPRDLELYLSFREPQRVRYTTTDGILHDEFIEVNYEFTTVDCSAQFQGDIKCQELVDWFDVDVVWSDSHRRTDSYGNVRGLGTIQRLKLWRDRNSAAHFLTFFANHRRRWKDFVVGDFEREFRQRDDRHRRLQLDTRGTRRGSASESVHSQGRRFSASSIFRRSSTSGSYAPASSSASQSATTLRYLGIQFTRNDQMQPGTDGMLEDLPRRADEKTLTGQDYHRFIDAWGLAQDADDQFGARLPSHAVELESPRINGLVEAPYMNGVVAELPSPEINELPTVAESSGSAYTYSTYPDGAYWSPQAS